MTELTPRSQKIPIENTPFSSAEHLKSLNFSLFTQLYHKIKTSQKNDQTSTKRKQWFKITRDYLRVERNNILFNFFIAKKIHDSRNTFLQKNYFYEWRNKFEEKKRSQESNDTQKETNDQVFERNVEDVNNLEDTNNNSPVQSPTSPRSKKLIYKQYSEKSTTTNEIPKPTLIERIKSLNKKTIIISLFIIIAACVGTYFGFHFYFKHKKFDQLYKKHKYESTLPPKGDENDEEVIVDYDQVYPDDQEGDLNHIMKKLIKKVENIKTRQAEMNEEVNHIQESLDNEEKDKSANDQPNNNVDSNPDVSSKDINESDSKQNLTSQAQNDEKDK